MIHLFLMWLPCLINFSYIRRYLGLICFGHYHKQRLGENVIIRFSFAFSFCANCIESMTIPIKKFRTAKHVTMIKGIKNIQANGKISIEATLDLSI